MPGQSEQEFCDPVFKQAVRHCWSGECAPDGLRSRIVKLLDQEIAAPASTPASMRIDRPVNRFSWMLWPTALAALLLLSFGLFNHFRPTTHALAIALPADLETNLILTHDHCCSEANHQHLLVPIDDDLAIAQSMQGQLGRPVIMYRPSDRSWVFRGASICPVGSTSSGHLVFARAGGELSIFSLPKASLPNAPEGSVCSATIDQHRIVGFVKDGAVFCMVSSGASSALSIDEMKQMQSQMRPTVAALPRPPREKVLLTELLRDSGQ